MTDESTLPPRDALLALNRAATAARLLSGAVHEVNNALQVISGTVELLEGRADLGEPVVRAVQRVRRQGTRAAAALAEVLVFTKGAVDESARFEMRETVTYCIGVRQFAINRAGLTVRFEPDAAREYFVVGTRALVQQAILNLLINAEQALAGSRGTIDVAIQAGDGRVEVRVADGGPGVGVEPVERAFEAFFSTKDPWQGAGLGLWAARVIAEAHGGSVTLEPRPSGSAFVLRLPGAE